MKPLLPALFLTEEDSAALMIATQHTWQPAAAILAYMRADRRDASIMYALEGMRLGLSSLRPRSYRVAMVHAIMRGSERETGEVRFP
jgi:hypothetical protein